MPQLSYGDLVNGQKYYEGQLVYAEPGYIFSAFNSDSEVITFGRAVVKGTDDEDLILPVNAASVFRGIAYHTDTFERREGYSVDADGNMGYPVQSPIGFIKRGTVAVRIDSPVTLGQPGYWRHTATGLERRGIFRADADGADAVLIEQSSFLASGVAGDIVPLSINLP